MLCLLQASKYWKDGRVDGNLSAMVPSLPGEIKKINVSINSCQCTVG